MSKKNKMPDTVSIDGVEYGAPMGTTNPKWDAERRTRRCGRFSLLRVRDAWNLPKQVVAERAHMLLREVELLERNEASMIATIQRYARALGGEAHVYIQIRGRAYEISPGAASEEDVGKGASSSQTVASRGRASRKNVARRGVASRKA